MTGPVHAERELSRAAERARAARDRLAALREEEQSLTRERDEAIRTLSALGVSYDAIAELAGVSRARVGQIVTRPVRPGERDGVTPTGS